MHKLMKKDVYILILFLTILFGGIIRSTILGWLMFLGILSWAILSFLHFHFHQIIISNYDKVYSKNRIILFLTHLIFLLLFLFQSDFDDSKGYVAIEQIIGKFSFVDLEQITWNIFLGSFIVYIVFLGIVILRLNKSNPEIKATNKFLKTIGYTIIITIIPIGYLWASNQIRETNKRNKSEKNGEYIDLKRALNNKKEVKRLQLYQYPNSFIEIPNEVFELRGIEELEMYSNKIQRIPVEISNLTKLRVLDLQGNHIKVIPKEVGQLDSLEELNLYNNEINEISDSICNCKKLRKISISGQDLMEIPNCLKKLPSLQLYISSDSINNIMNQLMNFENLEIVKVSAFDNKNMNRELYDKLKEKHIDTKFGL